MGFSSLLFGTRKSLNEESFLRKRAPIRAIPSFLSSSVSRHIKGNHIYLETGKGKAVIFSHGLFGGIFNSGKIAASFAGNYRFMMPYLPMYDMSLKDCSIQKLGDYLSSFIDDLELEEVVIIGSSMGGGAGLYAALKDNSKIKGLILCGSSGLSSIPLSKGYFKRKQYEFIAESTRDIFVDRTVPPDEMIRDVFEALQDYEVVLRSIRFTKAATHAQMHKELAGVHQPVLLVWGNEDPITPVAVSAEFLRLLPNASLAVFENCGHVPTQEKPVDFMNHAYAFLKDIKY